MSFVSYAQNFEDVMLWRALKQVENGFYVDVGANDPTVDSVTKAFYERGWHGINIEPLPSHHTDLVRERPRDINLQCAAGSSNGEIKVWECDVRGWATASATVVAQHAANGHTGVFHRVPVSRLTDICVQHVSDEIHFLKIDVEGFEKSVIDGMDFSRFRPWILVIEATQPNSTEEIHDEWENNVLMADYGLAYTDGLNRFYVAIEHSELLPALQYPPNVLDGFALCKNHFFSRLTSAEFRQAEAKAQQAEAKAQQAEAKAQHLFVQTQAILSSTSWRITAPLRFVSQMGCRLSAAIHEGRLVSGLKRRLRMAIRSAAQWVLHRPRFVNAARCVLDRFPGLKKCLRGIVFGHPIKVGQGVVVDRLPPRAARIYTDLKRVIEGRKS